MKTIEFLNSGKYFVAIKAELVEVNIVRTTIFPVDGSVSYLAMNQSVEYALSNKNIFYDTKEDFMAGKPARMDTLNSNHICSRLNCSFVDESVFEGWVFNDNIAEKIQFDVEQITIKDGEWEFKCCRNNVQLIEPKFYRSRQEVLDNNVVMVLNEDGTETEMVGINLRVQLNDDQKKLADEMKELIGRMKASGMAVVFNGWDDCISAINVRSFENTEGAYDGCDMEYEHRIDYRHAQNLVYLDRVDDYNFIGANRKDD